MNEKDISIKRDQKITEKNQDTKEWPHWNRNKRHRKGGKKRTRGEKMRK